MEIVAYERMKWENILIVGRFPEVFPKDLGGIPLIREIEFSIDLISGCASYPNLPIGWHQQS